MQLGYEVFYTTPGKVSEMRCRVCGSICEVKRDVYGPSNFIEAISKVNDLYDLFTCPNTHQTWHEKALRLVLATPSKKLRKICTSLRTALNLLLP